MLDPKSLRPAATMPETLHGSDVEQAQQAADIAEYLMSLTDERLAAKAIDPTSDVVGEGLVLFENLGCIACHSTKPLDQEDPFTRRSLHYAKAKFARGQLAAFLQAPQKHYAWSKMPDFRLSEGESRALAEFVQSRAKGVLALPQSPSGDATRGKSLFTSAGCASCHRIGDTAPVNSKRIAFAKAADKGCLAEADHGQAPDFNFTAEQRGALLAFLATDRTSLARDTPAEFSLRQVKSLNCVACHRRDGNNSVLVNVLSDEGEQGQTPEILPLLTWTGEKLKPAWSEKLIAGELDQRARPWLKARMPAWPARAKLLSIGLSHEHGFAVEEDERPKPDAALAKIGEQLVGDQGGFSCIKCHAIGKRPPLAPFEAPGINLASAAERLRYSYYPRWMLDPPRLDISTKMPKFAADGRTTAITTVLDGQAAKQYEALWHYIQTLK
jgi:mono/diheme cytochrome c family protein